MSTEIIAAGCTFPSGPSLALADIAVRTQLTLIRNHPFYTDRCGMSVKASYFLQTDLPFNVNRWQILADHALQDALRHSVEYIGLPIRLWLILPPVDRPGVPQSLEAALKTTLLLRLPGCIDSTVLRGSHAEAGTALLQICETQRRDSIVTLDIVVAVDSWIAKESMAWLEEQYLLHGSHAMYNGRIRSNPYGCIPGEGAAVLILAPKNKMLGWSTIQGIAVGQEAILRDDEKPCLGVGLSKVARQAIAEANNPLISHIVTDFNGEPYRADEYGFTVSRLNDAIRDDVNRIAPVLASGDIGCASLVMHLARTAWWHKQSGATEGESTALVLASSDDSLRSAVVLRQVNRGRN